MTIRVSIPFLYPAFVMKHRARATRQVLLRDSFDLDVPEISNADAPLALSSTYYWYGQQLTLERRVYQDMLIGPSSLDGGRTALPASRLAQTIAEHDDLNDLERSMRSLNGLLVNASLVEPMQLGPEKIVGAFSELPIDMEVVRSGHEQALQRMKEACAGLVSINGTLHRGALMPATKIQMDSNWIKIDTVPEYDPEAPVEDKLPGFIFGLDDAERARAFILEASRIFKMTKEPQGWLGDPTFHDPDKAPTADELGRNATTAVLLALRALSHHLGLLNRDAGPAISELMTARDAARAGDPTAPVIITAALERFIANGCYVPDGHTTIRNNIMSSFEVAKLAIASSRGHQLDVPAPDDDRALATLGAGL